jgi:hypothetical protein
VHRILFLVVGLFAFVPAVSAPTTSSAAAQSRTVSVSLSVDNCSPTATYTWSGFPKGQHTASVVVTQNSSFTVGVFTQAVTGRSGTLVHTFRSMVPAPDGVLNAFVALGQLSDGASGTSMDASTDFSGEWGMNCTVVL